MEKPPPFCPHDIAEWAGKDLLPSYFNADELAQDLAFHDDLLHFERRIRQLYFKVVHTRMLAGSEAYCGSLLFYHSSKAAAANGVPGSQLIAKRLAERFPGGSTPSSKLAEDMESPVDPAPLAEEDGSES